MSLEPEPGRPPQRRATDADRDRVFGILQGAYADGSLDRVELDERLEKAASSKTLTELADLTADLQPVAGPGDPGERLVLRTKGGSLERTGAWSVPPHILVEATHARVRLDLTSAVVPHPEVLVELDCRHTRVKLVVPRGWSVTTDGLATEWGKVKDQTDPARPGGPRLRIGGVTQHGAVQIRHRRR